MPPKRLLRELQSKKPEIHIAQVKPREDIVYNLLFVHHPAEDYVFIFRTGDKITKEITYIIEHHVLRLLRDGKRTHIPAPVTIEKYSGLHNIAKSRAGRRFARTHSPVYKDKIFHVFPLFAEMSFLLY